MLPTPSLICPSQSSSVVLHTSVAAGLIDALHARYPGPGIVLTLGPGVGSAGFTSSLPFLLTFSQGSFADYQTGLSTMVDVAFAPVPEPSGVAVAAAVVCCGWAAARRARRSLVCRANPTIL